MTADKAIAKKDNVTALAPVEKPTWLGTGLSTDRKVPRLLLMQAMSKFVQEEKAKKGAVVRSTTCEQVGGFGKNIPIIILSYPTHEWLIEVKLQKRFEFKRMEKRDRRNEDLPWRYWGDENGFWIADLVDGVPGPKGAFECHRVRLGSFFALLPTDMDRFIIEMEKAKKGEMPDLSVEMSPVQIRLRSFSYEASLNIEKMLSKIAQFGREPWQFILELGVKEMKNDDNQWYVFDFQERQKGTPTPEKYQETARAAFGFIQENAAALTVDETEEGDSQPQQDTYDAKGVV